MSDSNDSENTEGTGTGTNGSKDPHLETVIKDRDKAKAKARALESQLAELRARLDTVDQENAERELELARKAGDFSKVEDDYKSKLSEKDKALADATAKIAARDKADRETALVDAIAAKAGADRLIVKGLVRVAADSGFEHAPEKLTDSVVADAIDKLRALSPSVFKPKSTGAANPGTARTGGDIPEQFADDPRKAAAFAAGQALSPTRKKV